MPGQLASGTWTMTSDGPGVVLGSSVRRKLSCRPSHLSTSRTTPTAWPSSQQTSSPARTGSFGPLILVAASAPGEVTLVEFE